MRIANTLTCTFFVAAIRLLEYKVELHYCDLFLKHIYVFKMLCFIRTSIKFPKYTLH